MQNADTMQPRDARQDMSKILSDGISTVVILCLAQILTARKVNMSWQGAAGGLSHLQAGHCGKGEPGAGIWQKHRLYLIIKHAALSWGPSSICSIIGWADSETENNTRKLSHFGLVYTGRACSSWRPAPECRLRLRPCISNSGIEGRRIRNRAYQ